MGTKVTGIVTAKFEKSGKTKKGGFYKNVRLEIDGETTYGGFVDKSNKKVLSDVAEGDKVGLIVEEDGDYMNYTKVKILEKNADPEAASGKKSKAATVGADREFAATVGKATGIVQALISTGSLKTEEDIVNALILWTAVIDDLVKDGFKDEEEVEEEAAEEEDADEEDFDDDDEDEDFDED